MLSFLRPIALRAIGRSEQRLGARLDYVRDIAETDMGLLMRYNRLFGFLDPNRHAPAQAYHAARLRGALAADCGTCVEIEINLARAAGIDDDTIDAVLAGTLSALDAPLAAVVTLADAVVRDRADDPEARARIEEAYGHSAMVELSYAMNGAALLPGIKRSLGYATACDVAVMRKTIGRV
jgi:hypothetical protein